MSTAMVLGEQPFHSFRMIPHTLENTTLSAMRPPSPPLFPKPLNKGLLLQRFWIWRAFVWLIGLIVGLIAADYVLAYSPSPALTKQYLSLQLEGE